ncbi:MAG: L-threonylcarbamoyladenylate synthase [bacterium]|nr:L-threonylcarbamoyladenylate synthase [bacterium]
METIKLDARNIDECAARAAAVLRTGGVVLYPTDTLYGLGADALSDTAVAKIHAIKGREEKKPIHAIVSGVDMAEKYAELTDDVRLLAERLPQGQVTFIVEKKAGFDTGVMNGIATFGFRIPDNSFCLALAREFGKPITATSANKAGQKPERDIGKILIQLGPAVEGIDLVVDAGELPESKPSTVVDFSGTEPVILREGAISAALLHLPHARGTTTQ